MAISLCACSTRPNVFSEQRDERLRRFDRERERLERTNDPVRRTKIYIRISDLMISFIGDAVQMEDSEMMEDKLEGYRSTIRKARNTMLNSGRDASLKASGFRDLEIALRQHVRQLGDIGSQLTFEYRETIETVISEVSEVRDELLKALFPDGENATPGN